MPHFFYVGPQAADASKIILGEPNAHHAIRSARMRVNDLVKALDGKGILYECRISSMGAKTVELSILCKEQHKRSLPEIHAAVSLIAAQAQDLSVRLSLEMGASKISLCRSERSQTRDCTEKKLSRYNLIAEETCKLTGNPFAAEIVIGPSIDRIAKQNTNVLLCCKNSNISMGSYLARWKTPPEEMTVIIGPEGGLTEGEAERLCMDGAVPVNLGRHNMSAQAAAAAACAIVSNHFNEEY